MELFDRLRPSDLERRERQLTIFASFAIAILGLGTALLMYPLVFSQPAAGNRMLRVGFFGFCSLSLLLAIYLWDRQRTVQRLRREVAVDRMRIAEAQCQASMELLKTMPNMSAFQDRLPMEYRRTASTTQKLSVVLAMIKLPAGSSESDTTVVLGDAAKAISRRLGEHDSVYMLSPTFFAVVMPGADVAAASSFSTGISGGLSDVAGASNRFTFQLKIINYPAHASSAHELEQAVCSLMPADNSVHALAQAIV
jgi:hypothetical protein